jgi:pimeloyl-ACP methyl ester carboxylesterase
MSYLNPPGMPESARRLTIDTRTGPLAALDARPSHGSPLHGVAVMVPGFSGSKEDFIPMLAPITSAGFRVVCFDQRGQYESPGPPRADAYSMGAFAEDLLTVIGTVADGQTVHLLGHSFGGLVARRAVMARPIAVRSLTLLDSGPDGASLSRGRLLGALGWVIRLGGPRVLAPFMAGVGPRADRLRWLRQRWSKTGRAGLIGILRALAAEPDLTVGLAATSVPVLVMCGDSDTMWPPATQIDMARRLTAQLEVINNAGHTPNEDQPQVTARKLLEFWTTIADDHAST